MLTLPLVDTHDAKVFKKILFLMLLLASCSPRVSMRITNPVKAPMESDRDVIIIDPSVEVPKEYRIGHIEVSPRFFSSTKQGTYDVVLQLAMQRAKEKGGNAILVTSHCSPNVSNAKHRINADILIVPDDFVNFSTPDNPHPDYASIWLYRYPWGQRCEYDVYMGDKWVYWSRPNTKTEVRVHNPGEYVIWAKTEKRVSLSLKVEMGRDYYIETNIWAGIVCPNPLLFTVSDYAGKDACAQMELVKE